MKITPSSRVLRMLGEIEFDEWQCVAELIDNAFDDFIEVQRSGVPWVGGFKVFVDLPAAPGDDLVVRDTGRGMSYGQLEHAVRAGWSGNNMQDKLGLFGMGFNVSTARLGRRTRVLTTRQGDTEWIGVDIDLDEIRDDFEAQDITELKSDPNEHGTKIVISRLHRQRADRLKRNATNLRLKLGGIYSWILQNQPFELWVGGTRVKPVRHCRWGDDRQVMYNGRVAIPAYIKIDQKLEDALACADCGRWQSTDRTVCEDCDGPRLLARQRRVHGWLGIQRYLDKRDFGLDFLRNGRKILQWDKQLFTWRNPDGSVGNEEPEYPIDLAHQGGRIIGEIHLDHVPVTYQKDAFEYGDRGWRTAVEILRGVGPLQPKRAEELNYPENSSPLGLLFKGYRRNDAGVRCLIPGDGQKPIHEDTRRWGNEFRKGNPDYQTDERWWQAVLDHEAAKERGKTSGVRLSTPDRADEAAVQDALGLGRSASEKKSVKESDKDPLKRAKETQANRIERYLAESIVYPELSRDFGHPSIGFITVDARRLEGTVLVDDAGNVTPVLLDQIRGNDYIAFLDLDHDIFQRFATDPADLILVEAAVRLKVQADSKLSHSQLIAALRDHSLSATALDTATVSLDAKEVLLEIRERMAAALDRTGDPRRAFTYLSPDELTVTENTIVANQRGGYTATLGETGDFIRFVPPLFLVHLLEQWPAAFMDGKVFNGPYEGVASPSARRISLARTVGYLSDIATQASYEGAVVPSQLLRTRLSTQLIKDELADGEWSAE
ncbi:ATP-binding protein [Actinokineospora sp. G85]|uniref:ATP-binding protein n=1 Tax=Actinokineospora sp. G85 TaxID=3406626 RepID=UPI003C74FC9A